MDSTKLILTEPVSAPAPLENLQKSGLKNLSEEKKKQAAKDFECSVGMALSKITGCDESTTVQVGQVDSISLDLKDHVALVRMKIRKDVELTDDAIASVKTSGLIGDKYLNLSPGGSDHILKAGDTLTETESALDIEELISKYAFGGVK